MCPSSDYHHSDYLISPWVDEDIAEGMDRDGCLHFCQLLQVVPGDGDGDEI